MVTVQDLKTTSGGGIEPTHTDPWALNLTCLWVLELAGFPPVWTSPRVHQRGNEQAPKQDCYPHFDHPPPQGHFKPLAVSRLLAY